MEYGYAYLNPSHRGVDEDLDSIETADSLQSIRPYLCAKSYGDPGKCVSGCRGFGTCPVGQRAAVLLNREEQPMEQEEKEKMETKEPRGREAAIEALATGDPKGWLLERGKTAQQACNSLSNWKKRYPDLFMELQPEEHGGEEDQISVEDFLKGFAESTVTKNPNLELAQLMEQEAVLLRRVAGLQMQIWEIREQRRDIEGRMSH